MNRGADDAMKGGVNLCTPPVSSLSEASIPMEMSKPLPGRDEHNERMETKV